MRYFFLFFFSFFLFYSSFSQPKRKKIEPSTTCNLFTGYNGLFYDWSNWFTLYHFEVEHCITPSMYFLAGNGFERYYYHNTNMPINPEASNLALGNGARPYEIKTIFHDFYFFTGFERKFKAIGNFIFSVKADVRLAFVSMSYRYLKYYIVDEHGAIDHGPYFGEWGNYNQLADFPPDFYSFAITPCLEYKRKKASFYFQSTVILPHAIRNNGLRNVPYLSLQMGMRIFKFPKGS